MQQTKHNTHWKHNTTYGPRDEKTCSCNMRTTKAHARSLISTFVVHCLDSIIPLVSISEISSLYLASVAAQASLSLPWSQTLKTSFHVTRLIIIEVSRECHYHKTQPTNDTNRKGNEPCLEIVALFVLSKLILQTRMRNHSVRLDV